jgi:hypothetical protein
MYNHQHSHSYINAQMHKHTNKTQYKKWDDILIARSPVYKLNHSTNTSITYVRRQCKDKQMQQIGLINIQFYKFGINFASMMEI